jgi:ketosteroid isomerase-like protein
MPNAAAYDPAERTRLIAAVVRQLTAALTTRDDAAIESLLMDDVICHFPGENPASGTYRGREAVMGFLRDLGVDLDAPPENDTHDVLSSEAHGLDLSTMSARRGGRQHTWRVIRLYHFTEDRVSEVFVTVEDVAALNAFLNS